MMTANRRSFWLSKLGDLLATNELSPVSGDWPPRELQSTMPMTPELAYGRHRGPWDPNAKQASVMILICRSIAPIDQGTEFEEEWFVPLTLRHHRLTDHAGQISFPGGRVEPNESQWHSALRELHEELGILSSDVEYLGRLPPIHVFASNHLVHPFVAWSDKELVFHPSLGEVEQVIEFAIGPSKKGGQKESRPLLRSSVAMMAPGFVVDEHFVWGATAMILDRFLDLAFSPEIHD